MKPIIAIPSRYNSKRLPGKPLLKLGNKCLVQRCYESAIKSGLEVKVLTDDKRIASVIGEDSYIVEGEFCNGTERIAQGVENGLFDEYTHIINVQGDQPYIDPEWIHKTVDALSTGCDITHLYTEKLEGDATDSSVVKIIHNGKYAKWFSRTLEYTDRVVSIYGFTKSFLEKHNSLPSPKEMEIENIEQLRWIQNDFTIKVIQVEIPEFFVDINTQKDVEKWNKFFNSD